ncbi:MAG TPA: ABC transporter ATP-binding protein [Spirochaetia bacterium]|nr:ABC transporter ATP-binding protein [Spirochaetia bacterium]
MVGVSIAELRKYYGSIPALQEVDLEVAAGEFFVLLGPSGCGKTTLLRCIAGLEQPSRGEIAIAGRPVYSGSHDIDIPPKNRNIGFVFQNYALYPHMTVSENIAFGMKVRGVSKADIAARVSAALKVVDLENMKDRHPRQLSGGQQQRVAVARVIVTQPDVLLFDEPLSNLDPLLRVSVRSQLKELHRRLGTTSLFVTHDQAEAMILADRIGVLDRGELVQVGTGDQIYNHPATQTVAEFTGNPHTNFLKGEVHLQSESAGGRVFFIPDSDPYCFLLLPQECRRLAGEHLILHARPEAVSVLPPGGEDEGYLTVAALMPEGPDTVVIMKLGDEKAQLLARIPNADAEGLAASQFARMRITRGNLYELESGRLRESFGQAVSARITTSEAQRGQEL